MEIVIKVIENYRTALLLLLASHLILQGQAANADAGWITAGGSAHLIEDKTGTVSMQSEVVKIRVSKHMIRTDCSFVFKNAGPACTVRMGFPDQASMPMHDPRKHIRGSFLSFSAFVDGKKIKSEVIEDNHVKDGFGVWHASDVAFGENESKIVRNVYKVRPGICPVSEKTYAKSVYYILKTAASWGEPVKQGDIYVKFDRLAVPTALKIDVDKNSNELDSDWDKHSPYNIVWGGNIKPKLEGRTVHFSFSNLIPSEDDDIFLLYDRMNEIQTMGYSGIAIGTQLLYENLPSHLRRKIRKPLNSPASVKH